MISPGTRGIHYLPDALRFHKPLHLFLFIYLCYYLYLIADEFVE